MARQGHPRPPRYDRSRPDPSESRPHMLPALHGQDQLVRGCTTDGEYVAAEPIQVGSTLATGSGRLDLTRACLGRHPSRNSVSHRRATGEAGLTGSIAARVATGPLGQAQGPPSESLASACGPSGLATSGLHAARVIHPRSSSQPPPHRHTQSVSVLAARRRGPGQARLPPLMWTGPHWPVQ